MGIKFETRLRIIKFATKLPRNYREYVEKVLADLPIHADSDNLWRSATLWLATKLESLNMSSSFRANISPKSAVLGDSRLKQIYKWSRKTKLASFSQNIWTAKPIPARVELVIEGSWKNYLTHSKERRQNKFVEELRQFHFTCSGPFTSFSTIWTRNFCWRMILLAKKLLPTKDDTSLCQLV